MFEYESLYNTKMFGKTFHIKEDGNNNTAFLFFFYPVKFQESKYSSQLFDTSLFKDSYM